MRQKGESVQVSLDLLAFDIPPPSNKKSTWLDSFDSIPLHSIPFHSIPFHSIPFHSTHQLVLRVVHQRQCSHRLLRCIGINPTGGNGTGGGGAQQCHRQHHHHCCCRDGTGSSTSGMSRAGMLRVLELSIMRRPRETSATPLPPTLIFRAKWRGCWWPYPAHDIQSAAGFYAPFVDDDHDECVFLGQFIWPTSSGFVATELHSQNTL